MPEKVYSHEVVQLVSVIYYACLRVIQFGVESTAPEALIFSVPKLGAFNGQFVIILEFRKLLTAVQMYTDTLNSHTTINSWN